MPTYPAETYNGEHARLATDAAGRVIGIMKPNSNTELAPIVVAVTDAVTGGITVTTGDGVNRRIPGFTPSVSLTPTLLNDCVFGQMPDGRFLGMGDQDSSGDTRLWLSTMYQGGTVTRINSSQTAINTGGLQDTAGAEIGSGWAAKIVNAWPASNGDILMLARASLTDNYHLFRLKANSNALGATNSAGSDANYSNKKAILDVGRIVQGSGAHSTGITALSNRSFCEATINNAKVYLFAEYNINQSRTPGSTNDQARVWKSTDAGATWSALLDFNTDGNHRISHFHSVVQDPFTKWIYFLTGDISTECAVIGWNGVSDAPAANSSLATIAATAGWRVISGNELCRYTDLCFGPAGVYGIPDADTESYESASTAYVGVSIPKTLDYVASVAPVTRVDSIPPIMAIRHSDGWAAVVSFRSSGAAESYLHIWLQDDPNGLAAWRVANKVKNYISTTCRPANFWIGTDGAIYLAGRSGNSVQFSSSAKLATSVRFTVGALSTMINTFDGP